MNEIARIEPRTQRLSITETMAAHYNMEADTFLATMRATVFAKGMSREEEAAFLLVAKHHNLNPVTREIYAMPKKGGGIIPVVSIDGWVRMANEHPAFDGMEFDFEHAGDKLVSTTCRIFRKDRTHPIVVTEYLSECRRETDPWKMEHRMLRHKSMIQCARYAFGFAGIYDPDEAERFAEPLAVQAPQRRAPSSSSAPMIEAKPSELRPDPVQDVAPASQVVAPQLTEKPAQPRRAPSPSAASSKQDPASAVASAYDPEKVRARFEAAAKTAADRDALNEAWELVIGPHVDELFPPDRDDLDRIYRLRAAELDGDGEAP